MRGRVPILVGTGTYDTAESVERTLRARALGADAAFAVVPYYSRPAPAGVIEHFRRIADVMPTVAYNIPYRTGLALDLATLRAVLALPGIDRPQGELGRPRQPGRLARGRGSRPPLWRGRLVPGRARGGRRGRDPGGGQPAAARPGGGPPRVPGGTAAGGARGVRSRPARSSRRSSPSPTPSPVKWALARRGRITEPGLRLPLVPISEALAARLARHLQASPATAGPGWTDDELARFAARFTAQEIPAAEWTHTAHLMTGAWHVFHLGPDVALERLRDGIPRLNQDARHRGDAHARLPRDHHPRLRRAACHLPGRLPPAIPLGARVATLLESPLGRREALLSFYARERLMSPEARARWVEPDQGPLHPDAVA